MSWTSLESGSVYELGSYNHPRHNVYIEHFDKLPVHDENVFPPQQQPIKIDLENYGFGSKINLVGVTSSGQPGDPLEFYVNLAAMSHITIATFSFHITCHEQITVVHNVYENNQWTLDDCKTAHVAKQNDASYDMCIQCTQDSYTISVNEVEVFRFVHRASPQGMQVLEMGGPVHFKNINLV